MSVRHGVDVSAFQSAHVLATLTADLDFALVKVSEGKDYTSSTFATQWKDAKTQAKRRGGYHFARPEQSSAHDQCSRFLDLLQPVAGEIVMLDLEASKLSQSATNAWARAFGDELRGQAPGVADWLYMGSGYATNNTGKNLSAHFTRWMYPQYPSAYQLTAGGPDVDTRRAVNRSAQLPGRVPIARATTKWPPAVTPWLPSGLTCGWQAPDVWQFTDNLRGLDASVSALTIDELAAGGQQPEDPMYAQAGGFPPPLKVGERHSYTCPKGSINVWGIWFDSPHRLTYRIAAHSQGGHGEIKADLVVGGPASDSDSWPRKATWKTAKTDIDAFSIELVKAEGPTPDWDPTQPGADGKTVRPGWDASHTA